MFSSGSGALALHHDGEAVVPKDHFTVASFPRLYSWLALRRSRSYWMEAAIMSELQGKDMLGSSEDEMGRCCLHVAYTVGWDWIQEEVGLVGG